MFSISDAWDGKDTFIHLYSFWSLARSFHPLLNWIGMNNKGLLTRDVNPLLSWRLGCNPIILKQTIHPTAPWKQEFCQLSLQTFWISKASEVVTYALAGSASWCMLGDSLGGKPLIGVTTRQKGAVGLLVIEGSSSLPGWNGRRKQSRPVFTSRK